MADPDGPTQVSDDMQRVKEEHDEEHCDIFLLPAHIWLYILSYLKPWHKQNLRASCKQARELVNAATRKAKLDPSNPKDAALDVRKHFPNLEHLEVIKPAEKDCLTDSSFAHMALTCMSSMTSLKSISLENCTQVSCAGVSALVLACPQLTRLALPQVCAQYVSPAMLQVLQRLPSLSKLRLKFCEHCNPTSFISLSHLRDLTTLTALELEDFGQGLKDVAHLTTLTNLQSIVVWYDVLCSDVPDIFAMPHGDAEGAQQQQQQQGAGGAGAAAHGHNGMLGFPHLPGPQGVQQGPQAQGGQQQHQAHGHGHHHHHHGHGHGPAPQAGEAAPAAAAAGGAGAVGGLLAGALAGLDDLALHLLHYEAMLSSLADGKAALLQWVLAMPSLTHVDIQRVDMEGRDLARFSALQGLQHLGVGDLSLSLHDPPCGVLPSLTKLVVHSVSHEALLPPTCPNLRALSCDASDQGLAEIGEMTALRHLFLWNSPYGSITDSGLSRLSCMSGLDTFRLEGSSEVTDAGWLGFARHHRCLTKVDLVGVTGVTQIGLIMALRDLPQLRHLSCLHCPGVSPSALAALLSFCPLEHVELADCEAITQSGIQQVLSTQPHHDLEVVYRKGGATRVMHC